VPVSIATATAWEELAERANAAPFLRPGWFEAWAGAFGEPIELLTTEAEARVTGAFPYLRTAEGVRSATNPHTPAPGLLAENEAAARDLADRLFSLGGRVALGYLDAASEAIFHDAARRAGCVVVTRPLAYRLFLELEGSWESFEGSLPTRLVRDVRRRRRKLEELGEVTLEVADGSERLDELLTAGFRLEASGWKAAQGTAIVSSEETRRFYEAIARWSAEHGWLRLFFLRVGGRPIAFQLALEHSRTHYFLKGGYDPADSAYSPGKLLLHATLAHALERGLERYELMGDVEPWKLEWTKTMEERISLEAFRRTPRGLAAYAAQAYLRPLVRRDPRRRLLER
jgi:CelD/BcsL family acetyltransferase involved in cellulose biosynthesis